MWDKVKDWELAEWRVSHLEQNLWGLLINAGARHRQFEENSARCAWETIDDLTEEGEPLLLQEELVDAGRYLSETAIGQALYMQFQHLLQEKKETMKELQSEAKVQRDLELVKQFKWEQRCCKCEIQKMLNEMERLKIPRFFKCITLFFSKIMHTNSTITEQIKDVDKLLTAPDPAAVADSDYVIFLLDHWPRITTKVDILIQKMSKHGGAILLLESKFSKKCHSATLFLHSFDSNPESGDMWMSWHLQHFAKAFILTINPGSALPSEMLSQQLLQLKTMMERLNGN
ncbi:hypothetical protein BKA83DRAFT_4482374 [Pisolithus microcarpus]|nr:hypothetical protein BKA83DRAFT_4482374 [Pisolithus microcarpus]